MTRAQELQLSEPCVPRTCRPPRRIDSGSNPCTFNSPKEYYKKLYFEVADTIHGEIQKRFEQRNFDLYSKAEEMLLTAASTGEVLQDNIDAVVQHFGGRSFQVI